MHCLPGVVGVVVDLESMGPGFESRDLHDFFFSCFFLFFGVINTTVLICKFNITVSTQFTYFITPYMMPRPPAPSAL